MNKSPWDSGVTVLGHSPIVVQKNDIFRGGRQLNCLADSETEQRYCIFNVGPKKWEHFLVMPLHDHVDEQVKRAPQTVISFISTGSLSLEQSACSFVHKNQPKTSQSVGCWFVVVTKQAVTFMADDSKTIGEKMILRNRV